MKPCLCPRMILASQPLMTWLSGRRPMSTSNKRWKWSLGDGIKRSAIWMPFLASEIGSEKSSSSRATWKRDYPKRCETKSLRTNPTWRWSKQSYLSQTRILETSNRLIQIHSQPSLRRPLFQNIAIQSSDADAISPGAGTQLKTISHQYAPEEHYTYGRF